jgi:formylmethanofuran dehydrogenase subunit E
MTEVRLEPLLEKVGALHARLCPRQVLGVRVGLYGGELLGLSVPRELDKRLLVFVETDGCFTDGVSVATNCWVGRRTLRVLDLGKTAAVFADTLTERAVRVRPHPAVRERAVQAAPHAVSPWHAYLESYARMPVSELLQWETVVLSAPITEIVGAPGVRVECENCGEEVMNGREVWSSAGPRCLSCADVPYYTAKIPGHSKTSTMSAAADATLARCSAAFQD